MFIVDFLDGICQNLGAKIGKPEGKKVKVVKRTSLID